MTQPVAAPELSVVTMLYRSEPYLREFHRRVRAAAEALTPAFEIVYVDDGSPDGSAALARELAAADSRVVVVELSRNFGHHKAMMTGLEYARGDLVFLIDSDLEEDPALLDGFHATLHERDADVVYGCQTRRKGGLIERTTGDFAFWVFELLLSYPIPRNHMTVRLMRRAYVNALLQHREREVVIGGLWAITGFRQVGVAIAKGHRRNSTYSYWQRWKLFLDSVTSFSAAPLVAIFYLGLAISSLSAMVAGWVLVNKLLRGGIVDGWVSVMLSVWFLGGLLVFCVGVIGIYISTIFNETKNRPYTIVRRVHAAQESDRIS